MSKPQPKVPNAKCADNRRLVQILADKRATLPAGSKYTYALKKALDSVAKERTVIASYEQALKLPGVGKHTAYMLFPNNDDHARKSATKAKKRNANDDDESASVASRGHGKKRSRKTSTASSASSINSMESEMAASVASSNAVNRLDKPSKKEVAYRQAVARARDYKAQALHWRVVLLLDNREQEKQHMQGKCSMASIPTDVRALPIGDMTWVAQGRTPSEDEFAKPQVELVLGTIIERKKLVDLISSKSETRMKLVLHAPIRSDPRSLTRCCRYSWYPLCRAAHALKRVGCVPVALVG